MHPAFSVIFFTTASGAGYGLLALAGLLSATGTLPPDRWLGFTIMGLALTLITAGLLSSTAHLGHPERAWRAFSQWRTSWLSREGVMSLLTYIPAGLMGIGWVFFETTSGLWAIAGFAAMILALGTIFTTSMIYRCLKPIHQWCNSYVVPGYFWLGLATGGVLLNAIVLAFGYSNGLTAGLAAAFLLGAALVKWRYWHFIDTVPGISTPNTATGLTGGTVRTLEWPHTEENYLLKEMGYRVARKHAAKLRRIAVVTGLITPLGLTIAGLFVPPMTAIALAAVAVLAAALGVVTERWLFFAEAKHSVTLYYGTEKV